MLPLGTEVALIITCLTCCRSAGLARACTLALGSATAHLHPTDAQTRQEVVDELLAVLASHSRTSLKSACAQSLGLAVASSSGKKASDAEMGTLLQIVERLLSMLCTLCPVAVSPVKKMVQSMSGMLRMEYVQGAESVMTPGDEEAEVVLGIMTGKQLHQCFGPAMLLLLVENSMLSMYVADQTFECILLLLLLRNVWQHATGMTSLL